VREPKEWAETGVAAPATLLPLSDLNGDRKQWKEFLEKNRDKELILYCRTGSRSGRAAKLLAEEGYRTLNAGGFSHWQAAGLPTRKIDAPPSHKSPWPMRLISPVRWTPSVGQWIG